jgi:hypothetical protein
MTVLGGEEGNFVMLILDFSITPSVCIRKSIKVEMFNKCKGRHGHEELKKNQ